MSKSAFGGTCFSTEVQMWLEYANQRIILAEVGPDIAFARNPIHVPAGEEVSLTIKIGSTECHHRVILLDTMDHDRPRVGIETAPPF